MSPEELCKECLLLAGHWKTYGHYEVELALHQIGLNLRDVVELELPVKANHNTVVKERPDDLPEHSPHSRPQVHT